MYACNISARNLRGWMPVRCFHLSVIIIKKKRLPFHISILYTIHILYTICRHTLNARNNPGVKSAHALRIGSGLYYFWHSQGDKGPCSFAEQRKTLRTQRIFDRITWNTEPKADLESWTVVKKAGGGLSYAKMIHGPGRGSTPFSFLKISKRRTKYLIMMSKDARIYSYDSATLTVIWKIQEGTRCHVGIQQNEKSRGLAVSWDTGLVSKTTWAICYLPDLQKSYHCFPLWKKRRNSHTLQCWFHRTAYPMPSK